MLYSDLNIWTVATMRFQPWFVFGVLVKQMGRQQGHTCRGILSLTATLMSHQTVVLRVVVCLEKRIIDGQLAGEVKSETHLE